MELDPIPDVAKIGPKLQEGAAAMRIGWPYLCLMGAGFCASISAAIDTGARAYFWDLPPMFHHQSTWWVISGGLLFWSIPALGSRISSRVAIGIRKGLPAIDERDRAYEFLEMVGRIDGADFYALDRLGRAVPGELPWSETIGNLHRKAQNIVNTDRSRGMAWIVESYHLSVKSWIKARPKADVSAP